MPAPIFFFLLPFSAWSYPHTEKSGSDAQMAGIQKRKHFEKGCRGQLYSTHTITKDLPALDMMTYPRHASLCTICDGTDVCRSFLLDCYQALLMT